MHNAAIHGMGRQILDYALKNLEEFKTSGALYGKWTTAAMTFGRLYPKEITQLERDLEKYGLLFIVYSYDTPIGWAAECGYRYFVAQRFSVTTSKHQGTLYQLGMSR